LENKNLHFQSFGSSSSGNAALVWDDTTNILIDCGFYPTYIQKHLRTIQKNLTDIHAVLVTHAHADHVNAYFIREMVNCNIPIYCHENIVEPIIKRHHHLLKQVHKNIFRSFSDNEFSIGAMNVRGFEVTHDSEGGCFGFTIRARVNGLQKKISIATDLAIPAPEIINEFADANVMMIESNHDVDMLEKSPRTAWLKNRIRTTGHLSNDECAQFAVEAVKKSLNSPHTIVLAHLSEQCNTHEIAHRCTTDALTSAGYNHITVLLTHKNMPGDVIEV